MLNNIVGLFGTSGVANSYESIQTYTVGAGGQAAIDFTSIPNTYKHLQIRGIATVASSGQAIVIQVGNGGVDTSGYAMHQLSGDGSSPTATGLTSRSNIYMLGYRGAVSSTNPSAVVVDILDYANTNKNKTIRVLAGVDNNGSGEVALNSGLWPSTSALNTIKILTTSGNLNQYSSFALYGIKG